MKIVVDRDSKYAACCYLLCRVDSKGEWNTRDDSRTELVQTDCDWPSIAANLGFIACDICDSTDGTVDCDHKTAGDMITAAGEFLDKNLGKPFDDPGYFDGALS